MNMPGIASLLREMPKGYEEACFNTGAIQRKRDIKNPDDLMMLNLFHLMTGCSLVEISAISSMSQIGEISDVAFMKRFKNCNEWFKWIIDKTVSEGIIEYKIPEKLRNYRILAVDASDVREKGRSGRIYRLHFALDIIKMQSAMYNITTNKTGEKLSNFDIQAGDLVIADRIYASSLGIEYCESKGANYILRAKSSNLSIYDEKKKLIDIRDKVIKMKNGEFEAYTKSKNGKEYKKIRVCFKRKDKEAIKKTEKKLRREEQKQQCKFSDKTKKFNEYIVVVTSLDKEKITAEEVLELYRYRWQVELYFKRLKSILDYGELPKKREESIFSWLNGKIMIALLIEKIISKVSFFPKTKEESYEEYLQRN